MAACQQKSKDIEVVPTANHHKINSRLAPPTLASQVVVSPQGFLVIADSVAYGNYIDFLDSNNVVDIQSFTSAIGFTSQANVLGQAGNEFPTDHTNAAYVFDQNGIVQLGDVIYRGLNSSGKFLALPSENLNPATLSDLQAGIFNPSVMCRLTVGGSYGSGAEMSTFVRTHIGYDDPSPVDPPDTNTGLRWGHYRDVYPDGSWDQHDVSYHCFLGIVWGVRDHVTHYDAP